MESSSALPTSNVSCKCQTNKGTCNIKKVGQGKLFKDQETKKYTALLHYLHFHWCKILQQKPKQCDSLMIITPKARNPLTLETNIMDSWQMVKERKTTKTSDITPSKAFYCEGGKNWHKALNVSRCLRACLVLSRCLSSDKKINFDVGATMQIYVRATQFAEQTVRVQNSMPRRRTKEARVGCRQWLVRYRAG